MFIGTLFEYRYSVIPFNPSCTKSPVSKVKGLSCDNKISASGTLFKNSILSYIVNELQLKYYYEVYKLYFLKMKLIDTLYSALL